MSKPKKKATAIPESLRQAKVFSQSPVDHVPQDSTFKMLCPLLEDLLCPRFTEGGKLVREAARLSLFAAGNAWVVSLSCPTEGLQTMLPVHSVVECFAEIEKALGSGLVNWQLTFEAKKNAKKLDTTDATE